MFCTFDSTEEGDCEKVFHHSAGVGQFYPPIRQGQDFQGRTAGELPIAKPRQGITLRLSATELAALNRQNFPGGGSGNSGKASANHPEQICLVRQIRPIRRI